LLGTSWQAFADVTPMDIRFTRQAARRMVFDASQEIPLWSLRPAEIVGLEVMHPAVTLDDTAPAQYAIDGALLKIRADQPSRSALWARRHESVCRVRVDHRETGWPGHDRVRFRLAGRMRIGTRCC
jgi:hypothetical protein